MTSPTITAKRKIHALREQLAELKARLDESDNMLRAIRSGEVDAIVVDTPEGERLFVLNGAEQPYREMVETMSEGAVTVTSDGAILYCNQRFAEMVKANLQTIIGSNLLAYSSGENIAELSAAFQQSHVSVPRIRATLLASDATLVPVNMAMRSQSGHGSDSIAIVITDLTKWHHAEQTRERAIRALRMTNACSDVIIHAADEAAMLADVCQAMVAVGGYKSAWIGYTGQVPAESFGPVARAARTSGHDDNLGVVSALPDPCREPIGPVICPRHVFVLRKGDDLQGPLGCAARDADHRPRVTVPLLANGEFLGCWVMCSDEPDAFSQEELALLSTLAKDLAFGLAAQRNKSARARLAAIVESAGDAIVGRALDGTITSWNNAAERMFGYRAGEIIGHLLTDLSPHELAGESDRLFERVQRGETIEEYDTVRLDRDGRRIPVSLTFSPVRDEAGCIVGAAIFTRDCTARKAAEEAIRFQETQREILMQSLAIARDQAQASEERSLTLLQSAVTEALYLLDPDGNIETWNASAERIKGYTHAEIVGRNFIVFFTPEDVARGEPARVLASARDNGHFTTEAWRVRKDGSRFLAHVAIDAIHRSDGSLRGFVKVTHDITSQRIEEEQREELSRTLAKARDQAVEASQAKSRFLATVTHDLRTPLHGILGYAELLTLEGDLNATQLGRLEAMATAGHGLLDTINAVLDMSQIEANRLELSLVDIDLPDFLNDCFEVIRPAAEAKGLALAPAPVAPLRVIADVGRLRQVLINLLGNAVKFTSAGSVEVRLQQTEAADFVRVEVADTGPGVWARHRDKLFTTFERLNAEAVSGIEGTGLGLAISARLVRLMGGRIGYADNPGGGSVFWVELPCGTAPSVEIEVAAPSPLAGRPGLRVLVADDEALNRNIASGFLSIAGHDVVCVDNGVAAVEAASTEDFDVILMDVRMPGMNGLEATRLIRALPAPRGEVRVVAVTAQAFAEQIETCRQAGMDGHVSKPFKQAVLLAALENVMMAPNDRGEPAEQPPAVAQAGAGRELPVLDRGAFEDIAESLSAVDLGENLQILVTRSEALLSRLCNPGMLSQAGELAEIAHKLAGGGGTFGFLYVAAAARQFERAVESGAADARVLASRLSAAIEASLPTMRECIGHTAAA
jgi:PAS domain S-box-containing protein